MRVPTHWVRETFESHDPAGKRVTRSAYGWSSESLDDARCVARERARRAVEYAISGTSARMEYGYGVDPAREAVVDVVMLDDAPIAAITRNRYGALVLNTREVLFADIDQPRPTGWWRRIFRRSRKGESLVERIRTWHAEHPAHAMRLYRTAAGFRAIFTADRHSAESPGTIDLLQSLGCDPLYVTLCRRQKCFRARLTPKPWRCGHGPPGIVFPYADESHERAQREWERSYASRCRRYATCELVETLGDAPRDRLISEVVRLHDAHTLRAGADLA